MLDEESGWWVVGYTEKTARTSAFVLFDAYDNFRIWKLSRKMIRFMRKLDLRLVLGSARNVEEFNHILGLIERTRFKRLPSHWGSNSKRRNQSVGLGKRRGGDWCYYNPYTRKRITEKQYEELRRQPRPVRPPNYPTGFNHDVEIPGWEEDDSDGSESDDEDDRADAEEDWEMEQEQPDDAEMDDGFDEDEQMDEPAPAAGAVVQGGGAGASGDVTRLAAVKDFLRDCGIADASLTGDYTELRAYLRGRLGL